MSFTIPTLNMQDLTYTVEDPRWSNPVNWDFNASNIKCRAEALDAKVYVINNLYRIISHSHTDLLSFLSKTDSYLLPQDIKRLNTIDNEVSNLEDELDDLIWEKEEIEKKAKSPFVLLKNHATNQLHLKL